MPQCSQLPSWVSYLQALAVPMIAAVGAWIAAQQMWIARVKLRHDIFYRQYERRLAVYEATRKFLADVFLEQISEDEIRVYGLCTLDAQFLFDENLYGYLKEIRDRVAAWNDAKSHTENEQGGEEKAAFETIRNESLNWIIQQGDELFAEDLHHF
jgi:hypothetical protein